MSGEVGIDWLLTGEPRAAQTEALLRSYTGCAYRDNQDQEVWIPEPLPHFGQPAKGWAHFMEMRVGKTPTALNEYKLFERDHGFNKFVMLSPNKYKYDWEREARFFGYECPIHVFESSRRDAAIKWAQTEAKHGGMLVVNYEALISNPTKAFLANFIDERTYFGADESALMKNPQSFMFKAAIVLAKQAGCTRPMTGLPTPQAVYDFWSQLRFARALSGTNFYAFKNKFAKMGGYQMRQFKGVRNQEELLHLLNGVCFKARRIDWGVKIECDYEQVEIDMTPAQKKAYDDMDKEFIMWLDSGETVSAAMVITKRMKMQQIASGFIIDEQGTPQTVEKFTKTAKFKHLLERLRYEVNGKIIVVAYYRHTLELLMENLKEFKPACILSNQQMKQMGRDVLSEKNRFNNDPECKVMIGQPRVIKYGHTLMGSEEHPCLSMAFFENSYSLDDRAQTEERPQGNGQQAAIHIWDYHSSKLEKDIIVALQKKKKVSDVLMSTYRPG